MKFIYEKEREEKGLTLKHVEENQFFVCEAGYLCQKIQVRAYTTIADNKGNPYCCQLNCDEDMPIARLLPRVEKIEF